MKPCGLQQQIELDGSLSLLDDPFVIKGTNNEWMTDVVALFYEYIC